MTHLDVGYTHTTSHDVLEQYFHKDFPAALATAAELRNQTRPEKFRYALQQYMFACISLFSHISGVRIFPRRWTTHPWLLQQYLHNATGTVTDAEVAALEAGIAAGDISWHAGPFNLQVARRMLCHCVAGCIHNASSRDCDICVSQAEMSDPSLYAYGLSLAQSLDVWYNQTHKNTLSQKDVPGLTRGAIPLLRKARMFFFFFKKSCFCYYSAT